MVLKAADVVALYPILYSQLNISLAHAAPIHCTAPLIRSLDVE